MNLTYFEHIAIILSLTHFFLHKLLIIMKQTYGEKTDARFKQAYPKNRSHNCKETVLFYRQVSYLCNSFT